MKPLMRPAARPSPRHPKPSAWGLALVLCCLVLGGLAACGDDGAQEGEGANTSTNAGTTATNAGTTATNGETTATNAGTSSPDAGEDADEPDADTPDTDGPDADTPDTDTPDADEPDADEPDADTPDADTPDADTSDVEEDVVEVDCATFALPRSTYVVRELTFAAVEATGGSGQYAWSWAPGGNVTGGQLDVTSGSYLSGQLPEGAMSVEDIVQVRDVVCDRTEVARVRVVSAMEVIPSQPTVRAGYTFCFEVRGGSQVDGEPEPPFDWQLAVRQSGEGAQVDAQGCYTAGSASGLDVVIATDVRTAQVLQVPIQVTSGGVTVEPSVRALMLPQGEAHTITLSGSSGGYQFALDGSALEQLADLTVTPDPEAPQQRFTVTAGALAGRGSLRFQDAFFDDVILDVPVSVMARVEHPSSPSNTNSDDYQLTAVGDVNGDGYGDVIVSSRYSALNGSQSGTAALFLGGQEGPDGRELSSTPAQVITGGSRNNFLGRSIASGDFNGDGCRDVALGVWGANPVGTQSGEVQIWSSWHDAGCTVPPPDDDPFGGLTPWAGRLEDNLGPLAPDAAPPLRLARTLAGLAANDRFGWALAAGDFDGDGRDDLAVSAYLAETAAWPNPDTGQAMANLGRVYLFLNLEGRGLGANPDVYLDGVEVREDGSVGVDHTDMHTGSGRMAAADLNGDGCDDLLVGSALRERLRDNDARTDNWGFASVYMSRPNADAAGGCLVATTPAVSIHPSADDLNRDRASRLGWDVALADVSGDCVPDVIVSAPTALIPAGALGEGSAEQNNSAGAVFVVYGDPAWSADAPVRITRDAADQSIYGAPNDQFGWGIAVGDVTGDTLPDLLAGARYAEPTVEQGRVVGDIGAVRIFPGVAVRDCNGAGLAEGAPAFDAPFEVFNRLAGNGDLFGGGVGFFGDVNGDFIGDWGVYSPRGALGELVDNDDHRGGFFWHPGGSSPEGFATANLRPLNLPEPMWDDLFGQEIARVGDLNADGLDDYVVTASGWDDVVDASWGRQSQQRAGAAFLFLGRPDGLQAEPDAIFARHVHHTAYDTFGEAVSSAGDFNGDGVDDVVITAREEDRAGDCTPCGPNRSGIGAAYVYFGAAGLLDGREALHALPLIDDPDVVVCGPLTGNNYQLGREAAGGFDHNGDGLDDLLLSNWNLSAQQGAVWYVEGFAPGGPDAAVVCVPDDSQIEQGRANGDLAGHGIAGEDVTGDGCAELFVGAYNGDPTGRANAGYVRVHVGRGPGCAVTGAAPKVVELQGDRAGDNLGRRVVALGDVNGDAVSDVAVVSAGYGNTNAWTAVVYSGALLGAELEAAADGGVVRLESRLRLAEIADPGNVAGTSFGDGIAPLGDVNGDGLADFIIGAATSNSSGAINSGAAYVYYGSASMAELVAFDVFISGENLRADGRFGQSVAGGALGNGDAVFLVGAPTSEWTGPDYGEMGATFIGSWRP